MKKQIISIVLCCVMSTQAQQLQENLISFRNKLNELSNALTGQKKPPLPPRPINPSSSLNPNPKPESNQNPVLDQNQKPSSNQRIKSNEITQISNQDREILEKILQSSPKIEKFTWLIRQQLLNQVDGNDKTAKAYGLILSLSQYFDKSLPNGQKVEMLQYITDLILKAPELSVQALELYTKAQFSDQEVRDEIIKIYQKIEASVTQKCASIATHGAVSGLVKDIQGAFVFFTAIAGYIMQAKVDIDLKNNTGSAENFLNKLNQMRQNLLSNLRACGVHLGVDQDQLKMLVEDEKRSYCVARPQEEGPYKAFSKDIQEIEELMKQSQQDQNYASFINMIQRIINPLLAYRRYISTTGFCQICFSTDILSNMHDKERMNQRLDDIGQFLLGKNKIIKSKVINDVISITIPALKLELDKKRNCRDIPL